MKILDSAPQARRTPQGPATRTDSPQSFRFDHSVPFSRFHTLPFFRHSSHPFPQSHRPTPTAADRTQVRASIRRHGGARSSSLLRSSFLGVSTSCARDTGTRRKRCVSSSRARSSSTRAAARAPALPVPPRPPATPALRSYACARGSGKSYAPSFRPGSQSPLFGRQRLIVLPTLSPPLLVFLLHSPGIEPDGERKIYVLSSPYSALHAHLVPQGGRPRVAWGVNVSGEG
jgi:hypothetical protein